MKEGDSTMLTGKGKSSPSYVFVNGKRVSTWITEHGGEDAVLRIITNIIAEGGDCQDIRATLNVSRNTILSYIKKQPIDMSIDEKINRSIRSRERRSLALKGVGHSTKGKTYTEIYGTSTPRCGFKTGDANSNFSRPKFTGCIHKNKYGEKYRSSYEVQFSETLREHKIEYEYEHRFKMLNGKVKIVDFIINNTLVEVTGYAYEKWKQDFDVKIQLLSRSYPNLNIVIVAKADKLQELSDKHCETHNISTCCIDEPNDIISMFS